MCPSLNTANPAASPKRAFRLRRWLGVGLLGAAVSQAQNAAASPPADGVMNWQQCQHLTGDDAARLACYDHWARQQMPTTVDVPPASPASRVLPALTATPSDGETEIPPLDTDTNAEPTVATGNNNCRDRRYSSLSRFWELEEGSSCGTFNLRGYKPLGIALSMADGRPETPSSPASGRTAATQQDYQRGEMRINLSLRTKLAQDLFTRGTPDRRDSLWFSYSQQSSWQVFNAGSSRPFRNTDYEPELTYVYPTDISLPGGWRWRYSGVGFAHQSNGQSLPLSRGWNRAYLMGGVELGDQWRLTVRAWHRVSESTKNDDNPDIIHYIGRAELSGWWTPNDKNSYGLTWRSLPRGSARLEWLHALGNPSQSRLRLHTQLFYGYGDTLLDYNRRRTVLSIGLSLVDF